MKALTVQQPLAYLAGVLRGDAWLSTGSGKSPSGYLCLRVADLDFAETFAAAIGAAYQVQIEPRRDERGYWLTRTYNGHRRFDPLKGYHPTSDEARAAWLRGLFDSEGNAQLTPKPWRGPGSWERRVAFYSTESSTLLAAQEHMAALGMPSTIRPHRSGPGHLGSRPVEQLRLTSSRDLFLRFSTVIGSSILRKQITLDLIPTTYRSAA